MPHKKSTKCTICKIKVVYFSLFANTDLAIQ